MKKLLLLAVCCFCVSLVGCASTGYHQAKKTTDYGYYDINFQDNVFDVQFRANSHSDVDVIYDYGILRCCEVCLENGYKTFNIISQQDYTTSSTSYYSVGNASAYSYSSYNANAFGSSSSFAETKIYPYFMFRIQCFKNNLGTLKAEQVRNNLIKKHNIFKLKQKYNLQ